MSKRLPLPPSVRRQQKFWSTNSNSSWIVSRKTCPAPAAVANMAAHNLEPGSRRTEACVSAASSLPRHVSQRSLAHGQIRSQLVGREPTSGFEPDPFITRFRISRSTREPRAGRATPLPHDVALQRRKPHCLLLAPPARQPVDPHVLDLRAYEREGMPYGRYSVGLAMSSASAIAPSLPPDRLLVNPLAPGRRQHARVARNRPGR